MVTDGRFIGRGMDVGRRTCVYRMMRATGNRSTDSRTEVECPKDVIGTHAEREDRCGGLETDG